MIRINLLGPESGKQGRGLSGIRMPELSVGATQAGIAALFVLVLVGIGALWFLQSRQLRNVREEHATVQAERARLQDVADQVALLQGRTDLMRQKLQVIVQLKANQTGPVMLLDQISRLLTDGLWLTRIELDEGAVVISGASMSQNAVADFVQELEGSEYFTGVRLRTLGDSGDSRNFRITLDFHSTTTIRAQEPAAAGGGGS